MILKVHTTNPEPRIISKAVDVLQNGGIIIYPTDTVYGLGCSIDNKNAIEKIHLIKQQRTDKPFSFVCSDLTHISEYAHVSNTAFRIMKRLIPGPYTFILPAQRMKHLPRILVSKRKTVGIRVPASPTTLALVQTLGNPILSTSVTSREGEVMHDPDEIAAQFRNRVEMILDGGPLVSEQSTVIDLTGDEPGIVRLGSGPVDVL
ncbi:MAG: threonylcarbamoyl-AMP synthase [Bacteroidetes bacterium]|nr:threonylcarbamoyl-AMP synthase [Bacteroidota bacterium]MCW5896119.1 threonylcarbamoyl-AMP synthase [Bacteroidota bacterium]